MKLILLLLILTATGCTSKRMLCPTYKDVYKQHWMNKKFQTNIFYNNNGLTTKWDKRK